MLQTEYKPRVVNWASIPYSLQSLVYSVFKILNVGKVLHLTETTLSSRYYATEEKIKTEEVKEKFHQFSSKNGLILDVRNVLNEITKPIACIDASPTPPRSIGKVQISFLGVAVSHGILPSIFSSPKYGFEVVESHGRDHSRARDNAQFNLEADAILDLYNYESNDYKSADGSIKSFVHSYQSLLNSDIDYSASTSLRIDAMTDLLNSGKIISL